jgi:hypothetical protein
VPPHVLDMMNVAAEVGPIPERYLATTDAGLANEAAAIGRKLDEGGENG